MNRMRRGGAFAALAVALAVLAAGCCQPQTLERDYGRSVTNNLVGQYVNPQAGLANTPTPGLDPSASANLLGKYDKSFKAEEGRPMLQLTTGSSGS
jgi:hypothetical protein